MRCMPGRCIKCERPISNGPNASRDYVEDEFLMDNGNHLFVGRCTKCELFPSEYGEVLSAVNAALAPHPLEGKIVEKVGSQGFVDILKRAQGNRCRCGNDIGNTHVLNGSEVLCGKCGSYDFDKKKWRKRIELDAKDIQREDRGSLKAGAVARENRPARRRKGGNNVLR